MKVVRIEDTKRAEELFAGWQETMVWSCLQGIMGDIYAEDTKEIASAVAALGDFAFFAGQPSQKLLFAYELWAEGDFMILVPQNEGWADLIQKEYGKKAERVSRYAIKKEGNIFDVQRLHKAVQHLPSGYTIRKIDKEIYEYCKKTEWCRDFVGLYPDYETYHRLGLGMAVLWDGILVSGASSYSSYTGGIEIQIETREDFRRKGLAYAGGAALILECLKRNLYPSWDAHNKASVSLAEKLGYHYSHEYTAFECSF